LDRFLSHISSRRCIAGAISAHARQSQSFRRLNGECHVRGPVSFADVHRAASVELVCVDKVSEEAEVRVLLMATSK
jgi:hypothetical protein